MQVNNYLYLDLCDIILEKSFKPVLWGLSIVNTLHLTVVCRYNNDFDSLTTDVTYLVLDVGINNAVIIFL